jgi:uncharacterized lipoprotein YddW (UPF0748 family)
MNPFWNKYLWKAFSRVSLFFAVVSCSKEDDVTQPLFNEGKDRIVKDRNEIRAAWVATVTNLDWPLAKGNAEAQKTELRAILDHCKNLNFNAVILQVRPTADAFYSSELEPWSAYLTGTQGIDPGYDPLKFAVEEAHIRGMELHAWLNPYRIGATSVDLAPGHVALKNPGWVVVFNNVRYFNPGIPGVVEHLKAVVRDIVVRYDVDAIHFDDYFYPSGSKSSSNPFVFDDKESWEKYGAGNDIHIWRAGNISRMVSEVSHVVRTSKPGVLFGISPSGRRENSLDLYADPVEWLSNNWVDYLAPQIYWEFGHATADFGTVANYWISNARNIPMVIGIAAYKFKDPAYPAYNSVSQIGRQIELVRQSANLSGCFFFREKFLENSELNAYLKTVFQYKSVLPLMGIPVASKPVSPVISQNGNLITWNPVQDADCYAAYLLEKDEKKENLFHARCILISDETQMVAERGRIYFVTAVNDDNSESEKSNMLIIK